MHSAVCEPLCVTLFALLCVRHCAGVYVTKVKAGSTAAQNKHMKRGMRILSVNEHNSKFSTKAQVLEWMKSADTIVDLMLSNDPDGICTVFKVHADRRCRKHL